MKNALALLLLLAGTASADSWMSLKLGRTQKDPAGLRLVRSEADGLTLHAEFPGFTLAGRRHPLAGTYWAPEITGCGVSETVGAPELPVLRRLIQVPVGAEVDVIPSGSPVFFTLGDRATQAFHPRQRPREKGPRSPKLVPFDFDPAAYASDSFSPHIPCRLVEAGVAKGRRLVLVEVFPVAVNPLTQGLKVFPELTLRIRFKGGQAPLPADPAEAPSLASLALNAKAAPAAGEPAASRLLIIAPDAWLTTLAPLVSHRQARGWTVDVLGTNAAGRATEAIRATIRNRYQNAATRFGFLLLVGDVAQIPCFTGTQADSPDTDLYYACMDGSSDWQPEFPVGRLSVQTEQGLGEVVSKITACDTVPADLWMSRAAFMAGEDNHTITETTHNTVIQDWLDPRGWESDKLYTVSEDATPAQVRAALSEGRVMAVYSGHGDTTYWADGPVFYKADIQALSNLNRYPAVFSFACLTGQYSLNDCFAETWLRASGKGAVCIMASSVTSYWDEDDVFERALFEALFQDNRHRFGEAILLAKGKLIEAYGLTATVHRYFEQYNFFGDPGSSLRQPALTLLSSPLLPTAQAGVPYSQSLRATGGREPYTWSALTPPPADLTLNPDTGLLSGTPASATPESSFSVRLSDADGASVTQLFRLAVASEPLRIAGGTNAGPFEAGVPFSTVLTAAGGIAPYTWSHDTRGLYEAADVALAEAPAPVATGWSGDERSWKLPLPFAFRFFDTAYTSVWINSNGYLDFRSKGSQYDNSRQELARHPRIAPLWDDLHTTNIFLGISSSRVVVRWTGYTFTSRNPVDFRAVLKKNGRILFQYRRMNGKLSPTIGVGAGDGSTVSVTGRDGNQTFPARLTTRLLWRPPLPSGATLESDGVLSGQVATPVSRRIAVTVRDHSVPAQQAKGFLTLQVQ